MFGLELNNGETSISASEYAPLSSSVEASVAEAHWVPENHIQTISPITPTSRRLSAIAGNFSFTYRVLNLDAIEAQIVMSLSTTSEYRERFEQFLISNEAARTS